MLNRYGLFEAETALRSLERAWKSSGSQTDREAYARALQRAGDPHGDKLQMQPHVRELEAADHEHREALMGHMYRASHQKRLSDARKRRKRAMRNLHSAAAEIERHPGEFIERREGEAPREHVHRLATMTAGDDYGTGSYRNDHRFHFWHAHDAAKHAESLNKSIQHHYPHWNSRVVDWAQGSRVIHKGSVRVSSGGEWGHPHQPADR